MFHSIEQVSYHMLIVLLPLIIYHLFIKEEKHHREKVFSMLMCVSLITLLLTMSNPIEFSEGYLYDFRVIPIAFIFLYGGIKPGIILILIMLFYRFSFGGDGFFISIINYSFAVIFFILVKNRFKPDTLKRRIFTISFFFCLVGGTKIISLIKMGQISQVSYMLLFTLLTWCTLIMLIFIIDNLDKQLIFYRQIQQAERLNIVSQLAASVAHEVRNPMTSIKGFLQLIKKDKNLNDHQFKYIEISLSELERAEAVINDYLSLAKPTTAEVITDLHVTEELHSMIDIMTSYTNTHNILIHSSIQDHIFTKGKKNEFKQALLNIMKNSVESMHTNGILTISAYQKPSKIFIEIKDTGIGMTPRQVEQIGSPYYSTKDKGTGVGLTITYRIIRNMNGKISVQSEKGMGTSFTIELPSTIKNIENKDHY
ncbi:ATP-binding protein [Bacillus sp. AK128]